MPSQSSWFRSKSMSSSFWYTLAHIHFKYNSSCLLVVRLILFGTCSRCLFEGMLCSYSLDPSLLFFQITISRYRSVAILKMFLALIYFVVFVLVMSVLALPNLIIALTSFDSLRFALLCLKISFDALISHSQVFVLPTVSLL
jgi:hypothetical protein